MEATRAPALVPSVSLSRQHSHALMPYTLAVSFQQGPAFWKPSLQPAQRSTGEELGSDHALQLVLLQGSLVVLGGGLGQVMLHICSGLYQLKKNTHLRLAFALASLLKHRSSLSTFFFDAPPPHTHIILCCGLIIALCFLELYCTLQK